MVQSDRCGFGLLAGLGDVHDLLGAGLDVLLGLDADVRQQTGRASRAATSCAVPKIVISDGTRISRTTNASSSTAVDSATPNSLMMGSLPSTNAPNTLVMIAAAIATTRPEPASPRRTALRLSPVCTHSSCMRLTRNTW